jgi:hypothetical protein
VTIPSFSLRTSGQGQSGTLSAGQRHISNGGIRNMLGRNRTGRNPPDAVIDYGRCMRHKSPQHERRKAPGRRRNAYLVGLPLEESEALLNELWAHVDDPALAWTQVWHVGDLVTWDNRCTTHTRHEFDGGARRITHPTQVTDEARPVA